MLTTGCAFDEPPKVRLYRIFCYEAPLEAFRLASPTRIIDVGNQLPHMRYRWNESARLARFRFPIPLCPLWKFYVSAVAWLVSLTELVTGLGLMANVRGSLTAALILLILFTSVLAYGIVLGLDIDCGCLGPNLPIGLKMQLLVDASLVAWCGLVHLTRKQRKAKSESPPAVARGASTP